MDTHAGVQEEIAAHYLAELRAQARASYNNLVSQANIFNDLRGRREYVEYELKPVQPEYLESERVVTVVI